MADLNELHIGDWWEVERGIGLSCSFVKVLGFTDNNYVLIRTFDRESCSNLGFRIGTHIVSPYNLIKKSDLSEEEIKEPYRELARQRTEERLKEVFK